MWPGWPAALLLAVCATAVVGCGGGSGGGRSPVHASPATAKPPASQIDPAVLPPKDIPRSGSAPADRRAARVIRGWLRELRHGHIRRAAAYFAIPSKFQNGTPVLTLDSLFEVLAVNVSLPCGAVATKMSSSGNFTIVRFRLTERANGDCRGDAGNTTGGAIRVSHGKIHEWYRLYEPRERGPAPAQIDPGPEEA
jgi:hypothetical protein